MAEFNVGRSVKHDEYEDMNLSIAGADYMSATQEKYLEDYDKEMDELLLASKDVAKIYQAYRTGHIKNIAESIKVIRKHGGDDQLDGSMVSVLGVLEGNLDLSDEELGKNLERLNFTERVSHVSKDPEIARREARARIAYCNDMIKVFRAMLELNHKALNLSAQEAKVLSEGLGGDANTRKASIAQVKAAVAKNKDKFKTSYGYDFTSLGGGRMYLQIGGATGLGAPFSIEKIIQYCMRYDATILSHGSGAKEGQGKKQADIMDKINDLTNSIKVNQDYMKFQEYVGEINSLIKYIDKDTTLSDENKRQLYKKLQASVIPVMKKIKTKVTDAAIKAQSSAEVGNMAKQIVELSTRLEDTIADPKHDKNAEWTIGAIKTEWGATHNLVIPMLQDFIKHGHKKICILACNPGEVDLRKVRELEQHKDVKISFTPSTHLVETYMPLTLNLNEGAREVWHAIKEFIKKAWEKIKAAFRALVQMIMKGARLVKEKLSKFFGKFRNKSKKKTRHISIEPQSGNVMDKETADTEQAMKQQADNIEKSAKLLDQIRQQQELAFKIYLQLIDDLAEEGERMLREEAFIHAADIMENYCRLSSTSAAGENLVSDEIFDKSKKKKLQKVEGEA